MKIGTIICVGNFELPDKNAAAHRVVNNGKLFSSLGYSPVYLGVCRGDKYFGGIVRRDYNSPFPMFEQSYPFTSKQWAKEIFDVSNIKELISLYPDTAAVVLYNTQLATAAAVKRLLKNSGIKLIYDCTEWNGFTEGNFIKRKIKALDSRLIEKRLDRYPDGLITVSKKLENAYSRCPVLLLPPLTDISEKIWSSPAERNDSRFTFCYAGSPSDKENLSSVLGAFARLDENRTALKMIGLTKDDCLKLYPGINAVTNSGSVSFMGRLSHEETVGNILSSDCFIFIRENSRRNSAGFPTKFAEAFTCGIPVVTTKVSDIPLYADETCFFAEGTGEDDVLKAMREALAAKPQKSAVRNTFDYNSYTSTTEKWLERI